MEIDTDQIATNYALDTPGQDANDFNLHLVQNWTFKVDNKIFNITTNSYDTLACAIEQLDGKLEGVIQKNLDQLKFVNTSGNELPLDLVGDGGPIFVEVQPKAPLEGGRRRRRHSRRRKSRCHC